MSERGGGLLGLGILDRLASGSSEAIADRGAQTRRITESLKDLVSVLNRLERLLQGDLSKVESVEAKELLRNLAAQGKVVSVDLKDLTKAVKDLAKAKTLVHAVLGDDGQDLLLKGVDNLDGLGKAIETFCKHTERALDKADKRAKTVVEAASKD